MFEYVKFGGREKEKYTVMYQKKKKNSLYKTFTFYQASVTFSFRFDFSITHGIEKKHHNKNHRSYF